MGFDLHSVAVVTGSSPLAFQDRLVIGKLTAVAVPAPASGEMVAGILDSAGVGYTSLPTGTASGGTGGTITPSMSATAIAPTATIGSGYAPGDTSTFTGGTGTNIIVDVLTTALASATVNAAGTGYVPGDTITPTGGTFTGAPLITVTHTKAVSATVVAGGTGGTPGAVTITGTTGTGTKFQCTGTINGSGILTGALVVSVAGDYTVNPTLITAEPVTGGSLTGCTVSVVLGAKTVTAAGGAYTANSTTLTQGATSGVGTGVTFNSVLYGVGTIANQNAGLYTVLPTSPVSEGSSTGGGTGATYTVSTWRVNSFTATGGVGYADGAAVTFSGGSATTQATGHITTSPLGQVVTIPITDFTLLPASYNVLVEPNGPCFHAVTGKTTKGFNVHLTPTSSTAAVGATTIDILVVA